MTGKNANSEVDCKQVLAYIVAHMLTVKLISPFDDTATDYKEDDTATDYKELVSFLLATRLLPGVHLTSYSLKRR